MKDNNTTITVDKTGMSAIVKTTNNKVLIKDSKQIFASPDALPIDSGAKGNYRKLVPWGIRNNFPKLIKDKIDKSEVLSSSLLFNVLAAYGAGIMTCYIEYDEFGKKKITPVKDKEVEQFFEENDINTYLLEQFYDLIVFYNIFPELISSKDGKKIVEIHSKEAMFSRWEEMNPDTGVIENHFYSAKWTETNNIIPNVNDVQVTPVLNKNRKLADLRERLKENKDHRFIVPSSFPTPGRLYYPKPPWQSVFESGWYDISVAIPAFKKAAMENQMSIKYQISFASDYFERIFMAEAITDKAKQKARKELEIKNITDCLTGAENAKKTIISSFRTVGDKQIANIEIKVIGADEKGGDYLDDTEEASNIMNNAMQIHPSIVGSAPGKNSSISGTEARELFIIKQAMMQPYRDLVLYPFKLIKAINRWDERLQFVIPNVELTTLDKGTGAQKLISSPAVS